MEEIGRKKVDKLRSTRVKLTMTNASERIPIQSIDISLAPNQGDNSGGKKKGECL
jgi:hypothetical protein